MLACFQTMNGKSKCIFGTNEASRTMLRTVKGDAAYASPAQALRYIMSILSKDKVKIPQVLRL